MPRNVLDILPDDTERRRYRALCVTLVAAAPLFRDAPVLDFGAS